MREGRAASVVDHATNALLIEEARPAYSVCTLVNNRDYYADMLASFREKGFSQDNSEFLYIDTASGEAAGLDAYSGLNLMMARARGRHLILCHQDVRPIDDEPALRKRLDELDRLDPRWGLAGNAGRTAKGKLRLRMTDTSRYDATIGDMPARVASLDENFIVKKREAHFGFSNDLSGYHLYGADIATQARIAGWNAYVIDFHLLHFGAGRTGAAFDRCLKAFEAKYEAALKPRILRTTVTKTHVGPISTLSRAGVAAGLFWSQTFAETRKRAALAIKSLFTRGRYGFDGMSFVLPPSASPVAVREIEAGRYELPERTMVQRHLPADLPVIELGGAYGIVSRVIGGKIAPGTPHVIVEANPSLLPICRANAESGEGHRPTVVNAAVSYGAAETIDFAVTAGTHDSHLAKPGDDGVIRVPATTVSRLRKEAGIVSRFAMVIDIEGAEYELFAGEDEALPDCALAIVEVHPAVFAERGQSEAGFLALAAERGFEAIDRMGTVVALRNRRLGDGAGAGT